MIALLTAAAPGPILLTLSGDDQMREADCAGRDAVITGRRSAYRLHGCRSLRVTGDLLTVLAEVTPRARIEVAGRGDVVTWRLSKPGRVPVVAVSGADSRAQRAALD